MKPLDQIAKDVHLCHSRFMKLLDQMLGTPTYNTFGKSFWIKKCGHSLHKVIKFEHENPHVHDMSMQMQVIQTHRQKI